MKITNATLARFIAVKAEISRLKKEEDMIKEALLAKGSFETDKFTVELKPVQKFITIDADSLCVVLDPELVAKHNLIKEINYELVQVKPKVAKAA